MCQLENQKNFIVAFEKGWVKLPRVLKISEAFPTFPSEIHASDF